MPISRLPELPGLSSFTSIWIGRAQLPALVCPVIILLVLLSSGIWGPRFRLTCLIWFGIEVLSRVFTFIGRCVCIIFLIIPIRIHSFWGVIRGTRFWFLVLGSWPLSLRGSSAYWWLKDTFFRFIISLFSVRFLSKHQIRFSWLIFWPIDGFVIFIMMPAPFFHWNFYYLLWFSFTVLGCLISVDDFEAIIVYFGR